MKKLLIWSRVPYYNHCPCRFCYHRMKKYYPNCCPLPTLYIFAKISDMPASEPFISKGTVGYTSNCEFLLKIYHFPSFWKSLSSRKRTCTSTLSAIYALLNHIRSRLVLMRTSRKTHFRLWGRQSINNFSGYDIWHTTYKAWTGSVPLCPLMFSWYSVVPTIINPVGGGGGGCAGMCASQELERSAWWNRKIFKTRGCINSLTLSEPCHMLINCF